VTAVWGLLPVLALAVALPVALRWDRRAAARWEAARRVPLSPAMAAAMALLSTRSYDEMVVAMLRVGRAADEAAARLGEFDWRWRGGA
jgi:hypothetical protein